VFDPSEDYSCYKVPGAANAVCPQGAPQAGGHCDIGACVVCNSLGGVPGGEFVDGTVPTVGYCVCDVTGLGTWSCASDIAWPCPIGLGC
jgi:hypothetical protein